MKLVLVIIQDKDADALAREFIQDNMRTTKLATSGGLLKAGNTTFIIGIEDDRVNEALEIIKKSSRTREQYVSNISMDAAGASMLGRPVQVTVGEAAVLVLLVEGFKYF